MRYKELARKEPASTSSLTDLDLDDIGGFSGPLINKSTSDAVFNDIICDAENDDDEESPSQQTPAQTASYTSLNEQEVQS